MKRYEDEIYTNPEPQAEITPTKPSAKEILEIEKAGAERKLIIASLIGIAMAIMTFGFMLAYAKVKGDLKDLKQQTGQTYNLEGALTISKNDEQQIQVIYNGSSFFPSKIQIKDGIVFWDKDNRTYCADRTQVQIYIIALTKSA